MTVATDPQARDVDRPRPDERPAGETIIEASGLVKRFGDLAALTRKSAILDEHGIAVGRDTTVVERSVAVSAPPSEVAADLVAAGVSLFTIGIGGPGYDLSLVRQWVAWRDARR